MAPSVLLPEAVVATSSLAVMVDPGAVAVESTEPLSVADSDPVPEPLAASEVEKTVLVARVVVTTSPALLVEVAIISVVPIGITRPPVAESPPEPSEGRVVPNTVVTEPSGELFVPVA